MTMLDLSAPGASDYEGLSTPAIVGGWDVDRGSGGLEPGISASTPPGTNPPLYSPENPLFWFGALIVLGTGLVYVSTHWRIGKESGSISI